MSNRDGQGGRTPRSVISTPRSNPGPYYDHLPKKSLNIRNTPTMGPSKMTVEGQDRQNIADHVAFTRMVNNNRRHADKNYHSDRPRDSAPSLWNEGIVATRGTAHREWTPGGAYYDPLLKVYKNPPAGKFNSAPNSRPMDETQYKPKMGRGVKDAYGTYNPITGAWQAPAQPAIRQSYDVKYAKQYGGALGKKTDYARSTVYDPITGAQRTPAPLPVQRPTTAPPAAAAAPVPASAPATPRPSSGMDTPRFGKSQTAKLTSGTGTFDPITGRWRVPPSNQRYWDTTNITETRGNEVPTHKIRPDTSARGVYNPISNQWVVTPRDPRLEMGLSFQPATCFVDLRK